MENQFRVFVPAPTELSSLLGMTTVHNCGIRKAETKSATVLNNLPVFTIANSIVTALEF
jgi:hypothetical protein